MIAVRRMRKVLAIIRPVLIRMFGTLVSDTDTDMTEEPASGGCTSALGISAVILPTVAAAVVLRKRKGNGRLREGVTEKTKHAEET